MKLRHQLVTLSLGLSLLLILILGGLHALFIGNPPEKPGCS